MRYIVILTCLLASVGIVWALCTFNSTADGALTIISILATLIVGISEVNSLEVAALKDKISDIEKIKKRQLQNFKKHQYYSSDEKYSQKSSAKITKQSAS